MSLEEFRKPVDFQEVTTLIDGYPFTYYYQPIDGAPNPQVWDNFVNRVGGEKTVKGLLSHDENVIWANNAEKYIFHNEILEASNQNRDPLAYFEIFEASGHKNLSNTHNIRINVWSEKLDYGVESVGKYMQQAIRDKNSNLFLSGIPDGKTFFETIYEGKLHDFGK